MPSYGVGEAIHPSSIAVVGASDSQGSSGQQFFSALVEYGFQGDLYPINPGRDEVMGYKAYPSVDAVPGPVDYVISCIPAGGALKMIQSCVKKGVKCVHLFTARFSETGRKDAADLEQEIRRTAKDGGVRLIGPNCMGLYYPSRGIAFSDALPKESGRAAFVSQSGQVAEELVRFCALRGVYFSKAISYGNALDFNECDFLEYLTDDPETDFILMYMEGARDGERFFRALRQAARKKPVAVLKGGRGESGRRMASSHTSSLAGSRKIVTSMIAQAGAVPVDSLEELTDLAAAFAFLDPVQGFNIGVAGGGGGSSVMAADQCEEAGLEVIPLPDTIREKLKEKGSTIWDWIGNPADMSIRDSGAFTPGTMLKLMDEDEHFHMLLAIMGDPHHEHQRDMKAEESMNQYNLDSIRNTPILAVVPEKSLGGPDFDHWSWRIICEMRTELLNRGIPFYPTLGRAARAARKFAEYHIRAHK